MADKKAAPTIACQAGSAIPPYSRMGRPVVTRYLTSSGRLSEWLLNSGAYMHWISAMPVW